MHSTPPLPPPKHLGFEASAEDKTYPRDPFQRGRVRVALKDPHTGEPVNPEIPTRRRLLEKARTSVFAHFYFKHFRICALLFLGTSIFAHFYFWALPH